MKLIDFTYVLLIALCCSVLVILQAQTPAPALAVRIYNVTNPVGFPGLPGGKVLIFLNGVFQSPGVDYVVSGGSFRFQAGFLSAGDQIEVVTLP